MFDVKSFELVERKQIKRLQLEIHDFKLHHYASFRVSFLDENDKEVKVDLLRLDGDDYANWGADDDYVYKKACEKFGLSPECEEVDVPSVPMEASPAEAPAKADQSQLSAVELERQDELNKLQEEYEEKLRLLKSSV